MTKAAALDLKGFPRKVAVLGAGLMGSQIAAHLANAGIDVMLFGLPADAPDCNARTRNAIDRLGTMQPLPLTLARHARFIIPANYYQHLDKLGSCDLVIEAISENFDDKEGFYVRIAPYIGKHAIVTSNTSRLSINRLARALPEALRSRFCGMHFCNPPRYRRLVELIPGSSTAQQVLNQLEIFLTDTLGKNVVRAKDTPYFIASRIGLMALTTALRHAERFGLAPDLADAISRKAFAPDEEGPFEVADRIGSDAFCGLITSITRTLPDDPWLGSMKPPAWLHTRSAGTCREHKALYRWCDGRHEVIDPLSGAYRPVEPVIAGSVQTGLNIEETADRFIALRANPHPQAQFVWAILRDVLHYSAFWMKDMAETAEDVDLAMRWGFGWPMGPFETWQAVGWQLMAKWIEEDRKAHKTLAPPPLPEWVGTISGAYCVKGSYAPSAHKHKARSELPLYRHQLSLPATAVESATVPGKTVFAGRTDIRLWHDGDSHIAILSCPIADQSVTATTLNEMREAIGIAEQKFRALILWNPPPLSPLRRHCEKSGDTRQTWLNRLRQMEQQVSERQHIHQLLRYLAIPVIGTAQGYVSQCGCELLLHCDRVVAAIECQLGFPNLARGLFPAHGGCTEMVRRGEQHGSQCDIFSLIKFSFDTLMNSHTAANAHQARDRGLLTATDVVVFNPDELLSCAKVHAQCLIQTGYRPPVRRPVAVAGRAAADALINTMNAADQRFNGNTGGQKQNDKIAEKLAYVLCGGDAASHQYVDPDHLLHLEREAFSAIVRLLNK